MPRLFTGLEIPDEIDQSLSNLRGECPAQALGAAWLSPATRPRMRPRVCVPPWVVGWILAKLSMDEGHPVGLQRMTASTATSPAKPLTSITDTAAPVVPTVASTLTPVTGVVTAVVTPAARTLTPITAAVAPVVTTTAKNLAPVVGALAPVVTTVAKTTLPSAIKNTVHPLIDHARSVEWRTTPTAAGRAASAAPGR